MEREEWLEWGAMILVILAWWPLILFHWFPLPYRIFVYVFSAAVVAGVTIRRVRRVREGLRYSQDILETQRQAQGPPPLSGPVSPRGGRPGSGDASS